MAFARPNVFRRETSEQRIAREVFGPEVDNNALQYAQFLRLGQQQLASAKPHILPGLDEPLIDRGKYLRADPVPGYKFSVDQEHIASAEAAMHSFEHAIDAAVRWRRKHRHSTADFPWDVKRAAAGLASAHLYLGIALRDRTHMNQALQVGRISGTKSKDDEKIKQLAESTGYTPKTHGNVSDYTLRCALFPVQRKEEPNPVEEMNRHDSLVSGLSIASVVTIAGLGVVAVGALVYEFLQSIPGGELIEVAGIGGLVLFFSVMEPSAPAPVRYRIGISASGNNDGGADAYERTHPGHVGSEQSPAWGP